MGTGLAASWRPCTSSWRHCLHHLGRGLVLEAPIARDEETRALALKSRHHISSEEQHFVFVLLQGDQGIHEACDPNNLPHGQGPTVIGASPSPAVIAPSVKCVWHIWSYIWKHEYSSVNFFAKDNGHNAAQNQKLSARWTANPPLLQWDPGCHHAQYKLEFACIQSGMQGHPGEEHADGADVHPVHPSDAWFL